MNKCLPRTILNTDLGGSLFRRLVSDAFAAVENDEGFKRRQAQVDEMIRRIWIEDQARRADSPEGDK